MLNGSTMADEAKPRPATSSLGFKTFYIQNFDKNCNKPSYMIAEKNRCKMFYFAAKGERVEDKIIMLRPKRSPILPPEISRNIGGSSTTSHIPKGNGRVTSHPKNQIYELKNGLMRLPPNLAIRL